MREVRITKSFEKDLKRIGKNKRLLTRLDFAVENLANNRKLPKRFKDHALKGNLAGYRECHIYPDILLLYRYEDDGAISLIILSRLGTHAQILGL